MAGLTEKLTEKVADHNRTHERQKAEEEQEKAEAVRTAAEQATEDSHKPHRGHSPKESTAPAATSLLNTGQGGATASSVSAA